MGERCEILDIAIMVQIEARFERMVQQILGQNWAVIDDLWPPKMLSALCQQLKALSAAESLRQAAIGGSDRATIHLDIRSDLIAWWPDAPTDPHQQAYLDRIDALSAYLNRTCFAGIRNREFHFAIYPPGARYARHIDDFQNKNARLFSLITYLNVGWQPEHGGELLIYGEDDLPVTVEPVFGRTVMFPSAEIEHEVLRSHKDRMSVTGWMRK